MKKILATIFVILFFIAIRESFVIQVYEKLPASRKEAPVAFIPPAPGSNQVSGHSPPPAQGTERAPAQALAVRKKRPHLGQTFVPDTRFNVGKSYVLAKDVGAVPTTEYAPRFGELLYEDKSWSYFKKAPEEQSIPVAYHPSKNKFYPISSVLQIKDVTADIREQLLNEGHQEYHYIKKLKMLFIQSTPDEVLKTYGELRQKGYAVQLEVLSERPKSH